MGVLGYIVNALGESSIEQYCKNYSHYEKIDTSDTNQFSSLKQFQKYALEYPNKVQIVLNGQCSSLQATLSQLPYRIFENSFYSDEEITFALCADVTDAIPHDEL